MAMNPEIKKSWIEALRSGDYKQVKGNLKTSEGYCCLGVLCELVKDQYPDHIKPYEKENEEDTCPEIFDLKYGYFFFTVKMSIPEQSKDTLIKLNDECNFNFNQIAEYIENSSEI